MAKPSSSAPLAASPVSFASALAQLTTPDHPADSVTRWVCRLSTASTEASDTDMPALIRTTPAADDGHVCREAAIHAPVINVGPLPPVRQRERAIPVIAVNNGPSAAIPQDAPAAQPRRPAVPQQAGQQTSSGIPLEVAQLHLSMHETFQKQNGRRGKRTNANGTNAPWPKRWLGSRQWRQQQGRGIGLWESSFDGPTATAATGLSGNYSTTVTQKVSDRVTCSHVFSIGATTAGTASAVAGVTASTASTAAANPAVGSWASKPDGKRAKLAGNMATAPMKLMWLLNPRETLFQWAQARSDDTERAKRKALKAQQRKRKKAAAKRKAEGLPPLEEVDEELSQQLQDALVGSGTVPSRTFISTSANVRNSDEGQVHNGSVSAVAQATGGESSPRSSTAGAPATTVPTAPLATVHEECVTASSAVGHRLVTQYGRIWMPQQTPHGEEEALMAGDGTASDLGDVGSALSNRGGLVAPPNSVAESVYGHPSGAGQGSEFGKYQSNVRGTAVVVSELSATRHPRLPREVSEDDKRSFVTCMSQ